MNQMANGQRWPIEGSRRAEVGRLVTNSSRVHWPDTRCSPGSVNIRARQSLQTCTEPIVDPKHR